MNERIKELARQSGMDIYGLGLDRVKWEGSVERFAELIVLKCADIANTAEPYKSNDLILEHFKINNNQSGV